MSENIENAKTDYVRARISPDIKEAAGKIFSKLGLAYADAIRLFYQQVVLNKGLPFDVKVPPKKRD